MRAEQVVVVGAGPTGLTLACLLRLAGTPCRVVDAAAEPTSRSRAIGVSARSLEVLHRLGVADRLVARGLPSRSAVFYAGGRPVGGLSPATTRDTRFPFLLAVPQSATEALLAERLAELGGTLERGVRLTGLRPGAGAEPVALTLESAAGPERVEAAWVAGADGSHSVVRRDAGVAFSGGATGSVFANVDATLDGGPEPGVGHYFFAPGGMLVIAPLPDGVYRVTASLAPADADQELTLADVQRLVDERGRPGITVRSLHDAGWGVARVTIQARIADTFRSGRCLLAGDAAHIYGPTGAQGMNGGIQDAHALAWRLALVVAGRGPDRLLDGYAAERRAVAHGVLHHVEQQTTMATVRPRPAIAARNALLRLGTRAGLLDRALVPAINQFDVRYGAGRRAPRAVGRRVPDVPLGAGRTLFHLLAERPFTVLVAGPGPADRDRVAALAEAVRRRGYADLVAVRAVRRAGPDGSAGSATRSAGEPVPVDATGRLHRFLGAGRTATAALVRPDGHVAAMAPLSSGAAAVLRALSRLAEPASRPTGPAPRPTGPAAEPPAAVPAGAPATRTPRGDRP
jgi:2-polyprenyl-6-methoxyphenol hydroxylase-like FAD-dependent oxidoreductase